jgi:HAD superfamily hydrolase (TIGR01509 family)
VKSYILWDHDGVLVDTEPWYYEATRRTIEALGVSLELDEYLADMAIGRSAWEHARTKGASAASIDAGKAERNRLYQHFLTVEDIEIPGVDRVLEDLADSYAMAIVTTAKKTDFELIHRERKIVSHMQFVLASGDYERSKPAPDPYLAALRRFDAQPEQAVVVEDSARGLNAALAAGIDCIVAANAFVRAQDLSAATHHIASLGELPSLLETL